MTRKVKLGLMVATLIALPAAPAIAQDDLKERAAEIAEQANDVQAQAGALANDAANAQEARESDGDARESGDARGEGNESARGADDDDGDGFDWGLLGLLGLAGLLGLKRRDDRHVATDTRRDTRL